jgi:hypothetical protein
LTPPAVYPVIGVAQAEDLPTGQIQPAKATLSTSSIQQYVQTEAKAMGVNPIDAQWIVAHESEYLPGRLGDGGASRGLWQIDKDFHPEVSDACAFDVQCSTEWSLNRILAGQINEWTTWRFRCTWYKNAPDCNE